MLNFTLANNDAIEIKIKKILQQIPQSTQAGIFILNPQTNDTIFCLNQNVSLIPASNTKIFTTAVAISLLGPNYELSTFFLTDDKNISDKIINGNLYIKGKGNSVFTSDDLDNIISQLKNKNIKEITGDIIADDSFFDTEYSRSDWIEGEAANIKVPPVSSLVIDRNQILVKKKVGRRKRFKTVLSSVENPPLHFAQIVKKKLNANGIFVNGDARVGISPAKNYELASSKILLKDLIARINKRSDNFLAECLFKTISAATTGHEGTAFNSAQTIHNFLEESDINNAGTKIVDGSGISRFNFVTSSAIVGLLENIYFNSKVYEHFYNSLSIAGVDGTLRNRLIDSIEDYNFRGKTGTLGVSSSIAGYLKTKSNDELIICIIFQFEQGKNKFYRKIENEIIKILAEYNFASG